MKSASFHEILREKMAAPAATPPLFPQTQLPDFFSAETLFTLFSPKSEAAPKAASPVAKYKVPPRPKPDLPKVVVQPPLPLWVCKKDLDEVGQAKWNRFESMVGVSFGEQVTVALTQAAFRKFIKSVHPDLTGKIESYNFATFVKIKDEFIEVIKIAPKSV